MVCDKGFEGFDKGLECLIYRGIECFKIWVESVSKGVLSRQNRWNKYLLFRLMSLMVFGMVLVF